MVTNGVSPLVTFFIFQLHRKRAQPTREIVVLACRHNRCAVGGGADDGAGGAIGRRSVGRAFSRVGTVEERITYLCIGRGVGRGDALTPARPLPGTGRAGGTDSARNSLAHNGAHAV